MKILFLIALLPLGILWSQADILGIGTLNNKAQGVLQEWQSGGIENLSEAKLGELRIKLYGNRLSAWNMHPETLSKLTEQIEPLREMAIELAGSKNDHQRYHAASLLPYLEPTEKTKSLLLDLAWDKSSSTAKTSMDALFGMKWDTPELKTKTIQHLENKLKGDKLDEKLNKWDTHALEDLEISQQHNRIKARELYSRGGDPTELYKKAIRESAKFGWASDENTQCLIEALAYSVQSKNKVANKYFWDCARKNTRIGIDNFGFDCGSEREIEIRDYIEELAKGYPHIVPLVRINIRS